MRLLGPAGVTHWHCEKRLYSVGPDGSVEIEASDLAAALAAGFTQPAALPAPVAPPAVAPSVPPTEPVKDGQP